MRPGRLGTVLPAEGPDVEKAVASELLFATPELRAVGARPVGDAVGHPQQVALVAPRTRSVAADAQ